LSYYGKAAKDNFPRALNNLGSFYYSNNKYKDKKKCLEYFERATDAEYVKSLHNLGLIYYEGELVPKN
jgi:TPR repeat protein